jgi:hypothetical protein
MSDFNYLTPTALEYMKSPEFWEKRAMEQYNYIIDYSSSPHTRPDWEDVLKSAYNIWDNCRNAMGHAYDLRIKSNESAET